MLTIVITMHLKVQVSCNNLMRDNNCLKLFFFLTQKTKEHKCKHCIKSKNMVNEKKVVLKWRYH